MRISSRRNWVSVETGWRQCKRYVVDHYRQATSGDLARSLPYYISPISMRPARLPGPRPPQHVSDLEHGHYVESRPERRAVHGAPAVYVCTYVCMHLCIHTRTHTHTHAHTPRQRQRQTHTYTHIHICIIRTYDIKYVHYVCMYVCMYTHSHSLSHTHPHTNTHTHKYRGSCRSRPPPGDHKR